MSPTRRKTDAGRRDEVERWLDEHGMDWEYWTQLELSEFDRDASLSNQARFTQLDKDRVELYAEAIRRGDEFPAVVASRPTARGKLVMVDGNHRYEGHLLAKKPIDCYIVSGSKQAIVMMTYEANTKHGLPTSLDERVAQALWLVGNGMSYEQAAASLQLRTADVARAAQRQRADIRADEVGVNRREWETLSRTGRVRLENIHTDEGFKAAAKLSCRAHLTAEEIFHLVSEVNKVRSAAKQVSIVRGFEQAYSERLQDFASGNASGVRRPRTPKQSFHIALGQFRTLPENVNVLAERFANAEREDAAKEARDTATYLTKLADLLEQ